jgi:hypothetical protein
MSHQYTAEQRQWLIDHRPHVGLRVIIDGFNARFNTQLSRSSIKAFFSNRKIKGPPELNGLFQKGHVPPNKGKRGWTSEKCKATAFKPGCTRPNKMPVGSVVWKGRNPNENGLGYLAEKTAEPNVWEYLHIRLWESVHGPRPAGSAIIFIDGDRSRVDIANLLCVTRAELARLNQMGYKDAPAELKPTLFALAKLKTRAGKLRAGSASSSG